MPTRSNSTLVGPPPHDAAKPDDEAVDDVIGEVDATGSIERAARKLQLYAKLTGMQPQPKESEESEKSVSGAVPNPGQAGYYDPEEEEYQLQATNGQDEYAVEDEEPDLENGQEEGDGGRDEVEEIVHLQEIVEGLWVGDLVAAMDSAGLEERGIVSDIFSFRKVQIRDVFTGWRSYSIYSEMRRRAEWWTCISCGQSGKVRRAVGHDYSFHCGSERFLVAEANI